MEKRNESKNFSSSSSYKNKIMLKRNEYTRDPKSRSSPIYKNKVLTTIYYKVYKAYILKTIFENTNNTIFMFFGNYSYYLNLIFLYF